MAARPRATTAEGTDPRAAGPVALAAGSTAAAGVPPAA